MFICHILLNINLNINLDRNILALNSVCHMLVIEMTQINNELWVPGVFQVLRTGVLNFC